MNYKMKLLKERIMEKFSGKVFDIRRFCVHDGEGIRTTIFLKGCPLRCVWCQNPEGISFDDRLLYFENRCIKCQNCIKHCSQNALSFVNGKVVIDTHKCTINKTCIDACPSGALVLDNSEMTVEQVVNEAIKDVPFFQRSGGGVTVSGGEPFFQHEFLIELLKALKRIGINTAIETSAYVEREILLLALPYIDTIFCDCKFIDNALHKKYIGTSNALILGNIEYLLKSEYSNKTIIRTPLIPELTATRENIESISRFLYKNNPTISYELLNYNPLAPAKYPMLDMIYFTEKNLKQFSPSEMNSFKKIALDSGLINVI